MKKFFIPLLGLLIMTGFIFINSCKKDLGPAAAPKNYSFIQEFDSMESAIQQGWVVKNNSRPLGGSTWQTGSYDLVFGVLSGYPGQNNSHSGTDYAICTYDAQGDPAPGQPSGEASCWLISPAVPLRNGDKIVFYSRTENNPSSFPDRMQFRLNQNNDGTDVGNDSSSIGDFTNLALTINPNVTTTGYPAVWTKYEYVVSGSPVAKMGRFAFRYYTPNTGLSGTNGTGVGVDAVQYTSTQY